MTYEPTLITAPVTEAVSVAELKAHLGLDSPSDATSLAELNAELSVLIGAAREYYEWRTERTLHETEWEIRLSAFPSCGYIELPRATPLISITSVKYIESDATENTMSSDEYIADTWSTPGQLALAYNESWPSFTAYPVAPVRIRYKAGLASSPIVEADDRDKLPILMLAAALFENREGMYVADKSFVVSVLNPMLDWMIAMRKVGIGLG